MKAVIESKLPAPEPGQARGGCHVWGRKESNKTENSGGGSGEARGWRGVSKRESGKPRA